MSQVTTHVLDTTAGRPAAGVAVRLECGDAVLASGTTDADGRIAGLGPDRLDPGTYRLRFDTAARSDFFPEVVIAFVVVDDTHLHVPLLLSPHGYTTYRGS
ncbi:hydroxyisourate hydrolase [Nocardioides koreensis]|uniref:5-hydroxyisourate hydrolase n=1 Tax=Nocardioides koreensis TaxID=433651 RepID=A0ABN2Z8D4_9ACTN